MNILLMTSPAPAIAPLMTDEKRPPLGLGFLLAVLKRQGHHVHFVDPYLQPTRILQSNFLTEKQIDLVGIYANSICYAGTLELLQTLQGLRESGKWRGKIAVGGPHTSVATDTIPEYVDHVVLGEGEITLARIASGDATPRIVTGERVADLDSLPMPAWEEFIHRPYHWTHGWIDDAPVYTFNTSRGCPYDCTFCSVNGVWGRNYRAMSAERVLDDLEHMMRHYGLRVAYFREDHFTLSRQRTIEFCEGLLRRKLGIRWMCESRADSVDDPEIMRLLGRAGCHCLYIGVESGSPRMLELFRKRETVEQFTRVFDLAREAGIRTYASFVVGAPMETEDDLRQTYALIERLKPDYAGLNVFIGLPGSELYRYAQEHGLSAYETVGRVMYLKGHDQRVNRFYGGNPAHKIPPRSPLQWFWNRASYRLRHWRFR